MDRQYGPVVPSAGEEAMQTDPLIRGGQQMLENAGNAPYTPWRIQSVGDPTTVGHRSGSPFPAPCRAAPGIPGKSGGQPSHGQPTNVGQVGPTSGLPATRTSNNGGHSSHLCSHGQDEGTENDPE